jgi:hypothetical protein
MLKEFSLCAGPSNEVLVKAQKNHERLTTETPPPKGDNKVTELFLILLCVCGSQWLNP